MDGQLEIRKSNPFWHFPQLLKSACPDGKLEIRISSPLWYYLKSTPTEICQYPPLGRRKMVLDPLLAVWTFPLSLVLCPDIEAVFGSFLLAIK